MKALNEKFPLVYMVIYACMFFSCNRNVLQNCGVVISKTKPYNKEKFDFIEAPIDHPPIKILYKDSLVIVVVPERIIHREDGILTLDSIGVHHYAFLDIKTRKYSEYLNFADTARVVNGGILPDSLSVLGGLTLFAKIDIPNKIVVETLPDTTIDGVQYGRKNMRSKQAYLTYTFICYYRCDKKGIPVRYFEGQKGNNNCPMTKYEIAIDDKLGYVAMELDFVSSKLSETELKIFNTWERNQNGK